MGTCILDRGGYCRSKGGSFGVNLECPIATNGDFVAKLCESDAFFPNGGIVFL